MKPQRSCAACRDLLAAYVAHRLAPADQAFVEKHLATCAACQRIHAQWEAISTTLHQRDQQVPPNDHAASIWDSLQARLPDLANHSLKEGASVQIESPQTPTPQSPLVPPIQSKLRVDVSRRTFPIAAMILVLIVTGGFFWVKNSRGNGSVPGVATQSHNTTPPTVSSGPVLITTDHSVYAPTDSIQVTIKNTSPQTITLPSSANCPPLNLQQEFNSGWGTAASTACTAWIPPIAPIPDATPSTASVTGTSLPVGQSLTTTIKPLNLTSGHGYILLPGTYRLQLSYTDVTGQTVSDTTIYSATFTVQGTLPSATDAPTVVVSPNPGDAIDGCPSQQDPDPLPATDVVATGTSQPGSADPQPGAPFKVELHVGQTVQIRLDPSMQWQLASNSTTSILQAHQPLGGYSVAQNACIWRYTAPTQGTAKLDFVGTAICPPNEPCPAIAAIADFAITVKP